MAVGTNASEVTGNLNTGIESGINGTVITAPVASPSAGTYTSAQDVILTASGASSIKYTFDGSMPTCSASGNSLSYGVAIPITTSKTIKAVSCYANNNQSSVATFAYIINISTTTPPIPPTPPTPPTPPAPGGGGGGTPPAETTYSIGDINKSGAVDKYDFSLMMANWGETGDNIADLNGDKKVDKYDFALLMSQWSVN